ncbi:MAG: winged helix-turn-helix domain-containing protein [Candidatus Bathyarchaeia archaeon]
MRRSKLEMYVDILQVLAFKGPLKLTHIMYKSNVNCKVLKSQLDFLMKNGLVEERILRREKVVYAITQKGISTLKAFTQIKQVFPIEEKQVRQVPLLY